MKKPNPEKQSAVEAISRFTQLPGTAATTIAEITTNLAGLLAARWDDINKVALDEQSAGLVKLSVAIGIDNNGASPRGTVKLSFSQRTVDECEFTTPDPNQTGLPFEQ